MSEFINQVRRAVHGLNPGYYLVENRACGLTVTPCEFDTPGALRKRDGADTSSVEREPIRTVEAQPELARLKKAVEDAERQFISWAEHIYPVGCIIMYKRSPRIGMQRVKVLSHRGDGKITVRNVDTLRVYAIDLWKTPVKFPDDVLDRLIGRPVTLYVQQEGRAYRNPKNVALDQGYSRIGNKPDTTE